MCVKIYQIWLRFDEVMRKTSSVIVLAHPVVVNLFFLLRLGHEISVFIIYLSMN